ncbi:MAG: hypothetical protein ACK5YD_09150 [Phenylobacterium sp.]
MTARAAPAQTAPPPGAPAVSLGAGHIPAGASALPGQHEALAP